MKKKAENLLPKVRFIAGPAPEQTQQFYEFGIWGEINSDTPRLVSEHLHAAAGRPLKVLIDSNGGDVVSGISAYNLLKGYQPGVTTLVVGVAASIASVIAIAGNPVQMAMNARIMIHGPQAYTCGNQADLESVIERMKTHENDMIQAYRLKTGLEPETIAAMLTKDTWMTAQEAQSQGFVDAIVDMAADFSCSAQNLLKMGSLPSDLKAVINAAAARRSVAPSPQPQPQTTESAARPTFQAVTPPSMTYDDFLKIENDRRQGISAVFDRYKKIEGVEALHDQCLTDLSMSADLAKEKLLMHLGSAAGPAMGSISFGGYIGNGDIHIQAISNAIAVRAGISEKLEDKRNPYAGQGLESILRETARQKGSVHVNSEPVNQLMFASTTSDFRVALENFTHRVAVDLYNSDDHTYRKWVKIGSLPDYRKSKRIALSDFSGLKEVPEGAEYGSGEIKDSGELVYLSKYGRKYSITEEMIINDDLNSILDIPVIIAESATQIEADLAYTVLLQGHKMADGRPIFSAQRNNLASTGSKLSIDSIKTAMVALRLQKDAVSGKAKKINPKFLITAESDEFSALEFRLSKSDPDDTDKINVIRNRLEVVSDARLDFHGTKNPWFILAAGRHAPVQLSYLRGKKEPTITRHEDYSTDSIVFKVKHVCGAQCVFPQGAYMNPGV